VPDEEVFMNTVWKVLFVTGVVFVSLAGCQPGNENETDGQPALEATTVTPYLKHPMPETGNLIFCTTFQIAWDELKNKIIKSDISMVDETPMVGFLNEGTSGKVDENDYVAAAGFGRDNIVAIINGELKRKFGETVPTLQTEMEEDDILAYSYLFKNLLFAEEFEDIEHTVFFQGSESADIEVFGIEKYDPEVHEKMGEQVTILDYEDDLDFVLELATTSRDDIMVLAMVEPQKTLLETFEAVEERIAKAQPGIMKEDDVLKIPKMRFDIAHSYDELLNKTLKNRGFTDYFIAKAEHSIRFKLDQKGALLESDAEIMLKKNGNEGRYFVFSQPFMFYLKQKDAEYPYLAIWVNNPEILINTEKK
jgi:hypothetical protein